MSSKFIQLSWLWSVLEREWNWKLEPLQRVLKMKSYFPVVNSLPTQAKLRTKKLWNKNIMGWKKFGHSHEQHVIQLLYVIESAAYRVIFMSYLCQNANEWGTSEWKLLTQTSEYNPTQSTFYDVSCLSHILREFSLK